jgi:hypothetical protein
MLYSNVTEHSNPPMGRKHADRSKEPLDEAESKV